MAEGNPIRFSDLFNFDDNSGVKSASALITDLNSSYKEFIATVMGAGWDALKNQQKDIADTARVMADQISRATQSTKEGQETLIGYTKAMVEQEVEAKKLLETKKSLKAVEDLAADSVDGLTKSLKEQISAYNKLSPTEEAQKKQMDDLVVSITKTKEEINQLTGSLKLNTSSFSLAKNSYAALDLETKKLISSLKNMSGGMVEGNKEAEALKKQIFDNTTALKNFDAQMNIHNRNVGNYASALAGAKNTQMAFSQVLREGPAFAYSFSTGLLGMSNNIPILADNINKLKETNDGLRASGEKTIPIWKTLLGAITSPIGLITLATSVITIFAARWKGAAADMTEAEKAAEKLKDKIRDLNIAVKENYVNELTKTNDLFESAADLGLTYDARVAAIEKIIQLYPTLLSNLDQEAMLNGKVADKQDVISKIISKKSFIKYYEDLAAATAESKKELEKQFAESNKAGGLYNPFSSSGTVQDIAKQEEQIKRLNAEIEDAKFNADILRREIKYLLDPKETHEGRILIDIDNEIKQQQTIRDTTTIEDKAHQAAIKRLKELSEERRKYLGEEDKKPKDARKNMEQQLRDAEAFYGEWNLIVEKGYENSAKTATDEIAFEQSKLTISRDLYNLKLKILDDYYNGVGKLDKKQKEDRLKNNKELSESEIKAQKANNKIKKELNDDFIERQRHLDENLATLREAKKELDNLNEEFKEDKVKAGKVNPFYAMLGIEEEKPDYRAEDRRIKRLKQKRAEEEAKKITGSYTLSDKTANLSLIDNDITATENDKKIKEEERLAEAKKEVWRKTTEFGEQLESKLFEIKRANIERAIQATQMQGQFELSIAGNNTAAKIRIEKETQHKLSQLRKQQAQQEKAQAIFTAIIDTYKGVAAAIAKGPPQSIPLSAIALAQGLANVAMISSKQIPAYWKGRGKGVNELARVNELGPELIEKDGKFRVAGGGKETITHLDANEIVHTHKESQTIMQKNKWLDDLLKGTGAYRQREENNRMELQSMIVKQMTTKKDFKDAIIEGFKTIPQSTYQQPAQDVQDRHTRLQLRNGL
jgi:hypothetical protein